MSRPPRCNASRATRSPPAPAEPAERTAAPSVQHRLSAGRGHGRQEDRMPALEGLEDAKPARQRFWDRHASPISILILGSLLLAAVLGFAGGQPSPPRTADFGEARLTVKTPLIIRNGEFFETDLTLTAEAPLGDAVIAVTPSLWPDMTAN